ncbi:FMN-binding negative transcriptional regulator, partial [Sansalvadorimonas verongulae]|uniref:FMN-binding negative transcriptional regulator n=1 Tax=Sansalvadorimonas verongulae TaxID=2172824 RepID=UPI0018AD12E7
EFNGFPDRHYISPNYYPSKKKTGKVVPTWNYSVVHVRGRIYFRHEGRWILQLLNNISNTHEAQQTTPWVVSDAPDDFTHKLVNAVIGLEVVVESIIGNFKLSQNKEGADYAGVVQGLSNSERCTEVAIAEQMQKFQSKGTLS